MIFMDFHENNTQFKNQSTKFPPSTNFLVSNSERFQIAHIEDFHSLRKIGRQKIGIAK
jgi:hypothetical protein